MCCVDTFANTFLQHKTRKKHDSSINYPHLIQLATEMDTVQWLKILKVSVQLSLQREYYNQWYAKPIPTGEKHKYPSLAVNSPFLTVLQFLNSIYFHVQADITMIFFIIIMIMLFIVIFLSLLKQNRSFPMQKGFFRPISC